MGNFQTGGRVVEVRRKLGSWSFSIDGRASGKRYMSRARASGAGLLAVQRIARVLARRAAEREAAAAASGGTPAVAVSPGRREAGAEVRARRAPAPQLASG